jgi:hypothetical protein
LHFIAFLANLIVYPPLQAPTSIITESSLTRAFESFNISLSASSKIKIKSKVLQSNIFLIFVYLKRR